MLGPVLRRFVSVLCLFETQRVLASPSYDQLIPRATAMNGTALVPYPQSVQFDGNSSPLDKDDFRIVLADVSPKPCDILEQAAERYKQLIFVGSNSFRRFLARIRRRAVQRRLKRSADNADSSAEQDTQPEAEAMDNEPVVPVVDEEQGQNSEAAETAESNDDREANRYPWTKQRDQDQYVNRNDPGEKLKAVELRVDSGVCDEKPSLEMDESYTITFEGSTATIRSHAVWGALRGLETFSQLTYNSPDGEFWIRRARIQDSPRFPFRGLLLDTSRHYLPKSYTYKNLDLLAQNKYNVFHWHIVDDQSFPYQSQVFPDLSGKGAYTQRHVYSRQDVADIIEYGRLRGIRVVPEFDTPGHTLSWGPGGAKGLLTKCYKDGKWDGSYGPIDISRAETYDFIEALFREVLTTFPDNAVHLGGDEVDHSCWLSNPAVKKWMNENGYKTGSDDENFYIQKLLETVERVRPGTSPVVWQEVFDNGVHISKDTVVNVWKNEPMKEMAAVTKAGHKAILSSPWYLNYVNYGPDWKPFYEADPQDFPGTDEQKKLVMGGTACMWGEFIDATNVIPVLWPRASVVAERLWSAASQKDEQEFAPRFDSHRCRLLKRGYPVAPPNIGRNGYCNEEWGDMQKRKR